MFAHEKNNMQELLGHKVESVNSPQIYTFSLIVWNSNFLWITLELNLILCLIATNSDFLITISLETNVAYLRYFKLWILLDQIIWVLNVKGLHHRVLKILRFKYLILFQSLNSFKIKPIGVLKSQSDTAVMSQNHKVIMLWCRIITKWYCCDVAKSQSDTAVISLNHKVILLWCRIITKWYCCDVVKSQSDTAVIPQITKW